MGKKVEIGEVGGGESQRHVEESPVRLNLTPVAGVCGQQLQIRCGERIEMVDNGTRTREPE